MPRTPTKKGNEQKTQRTKRLKSTPTHSQDPCWRPAVFRRAPSAPARSVRVSHDSDPTSGHEPCPKPLPNPNPNPRPTRFVTSEGLKPSPTFGPAWPQQRTASVRVGHPVERYGQRALFNVAPKTQTKQLSPANLCSRSPSPFRPADPAASLLARAPRGRRTLDPTFVLQ